MTATTSSIPYTPTSPGWSSVHPRPLSPICPHPNLDDIHTPPIPSPLRSHVFHTTSYGVYRLTTHVVPAAYPRLAPYIHISEIPAYMPRESSADRRSKADALVRQVLRTQNAYHEGELGEAPSERLLWNCVNRYVRTPGPHNGVTLFLAHANGFHKETWETVLRNLLDAPAGAVVDEVWAWEAVQHGDAAVINAKNLSGIYDWLDNTRDTANFLIHYLPEDVEAGLLPTRLPLLPSSLAKRRKNNGYRTRKLVAVGHSFGGCTSLRVAIDFPMLFSSIVLVDPVIRRPSSYPSGYLHGMVLGAFARRDRWPSRGEALQLFQKSPFFNAWHPDVLRDYVDYALVDDAEGYVRLKMSGIQEGLSFANEIPSNEMWELLERLDERVTLRWVVPEKPLSTKEMTYERVWRRPANSTNVVFHFAGHLIVQEAPLELARDISDFLLGQHGCVKPHL